MKFLVDRCVGRRVSRHLNNQGHDVLDGRDIVADPGDRNLLELAALENRVLITLDKGFGELIYVLHVPHAGLIRLPDVRMAERDRPCRGCYQSARPRPGTKGDSHHPGRPDPRIPAGHDVSPKSNITRPCVTYLETP